MSNVVHLKPEPMIWVCNCGCTTFRVHDDQSLECANCDMRQSLGGEWIKEPLPANPRELDSVEDVKSVMSTPEWTLRRLLSDDPDDIAVLIAVKQDGKTTTWSDDCTGAERIEWLDRRLAEARKFVTKA